MRPIRPGPEFERRTPSGANAASRTGTEGQRGGNRFGPDPKVAEPPIIDKELLTNYDILAMVEIQLGVGVIVSKIRDTRSDFALSSSDLIELKQHGVSETVIEAMLESQAKQTHDH